MDCKTNVDIIYFDIAKEIMGKSTTNLCSISGSYICYKYSHVIVAFFLQETPAEIKLEINT